MNFSFYFIKHCDRITGLSDATKPKGRVCFTRDMMSSEKSEENEDHLFIIPTLPWRRKNLTKLLYALDKKSSKNCSVRSKHYDLKWMKAFLLID